MTIPGELSIHVSDPVWRSRRSYTERLAELAQGYNQTIQADGGFWSAGWSRPCSVAYADNWLEEGLGRHVETVARDLTTVWEGFINRVTVMKGGLTASIGPLLNIGNRVHLVYSTVDETADPPAVGLRRRTATYNDTDSQSRWGIMQKALSGGGMVPTAAEAMPGSWLAENAEPTRTQDFGGGGDPIVQVEALGYYHLMTWLYNQTATSGTVAVSAPLGAGKLQLVMAADPNGIFSTDRTRQVNNALTVSPWENDDKRARDIIEALVKLGDASYNRYLFGIYEGRIAEYRAAPTDVKYTQRLSDPLGEVRLSPDAQMPQWAVRPGYWLRYVDHLIDKPERASLREDPRYEFVEWVTYRPDSIPRVEHGGGRTDKLPQMLAQIGLAGIGGT